MEIGMYIENRGPAATPENLTRYAQRAEALGFRFLCLSEHVVAPVRPPERDQYRLKNKVHGWDDVHTYYEPLVTLAYLGGKTQTIRLGTSVMIVPYRNPVVTAKALATLDALTGGRLFVGIGTGWWQDEYAALGLGDHFADRGARADEYLRVYKTLWSQESASFHGRYCRFDEIACAPKPVQKPAPPIWVGGSGRRVLRRVVELGDVWHPIGPKASGELDLEDLAARRAELDALACHAGRDPATIGVSLKGPVRFSPRERRALVGTPAQVADDIRAYAARGVTHLTINLARLPGDFLERMEEIGERLLPLLH
ncbi:MAG: LLM class F420-dependent oxidoreductase [Candidatus Lambdaproteobacteria bacterium]|nr:LLM class F420-dependent oxidoreductase [Candidatus Lambdaproteobacteria bacterium]